MHIHCYNLFALCNKRNLYHNNLYGSITCFYLDKYVNSMLNTRQEREKSLITLGLQPFSAAFLCMSLKKMVFDSNMNGKQEQIAVMKRHE